MALQGGISQYNYVHVRRPRGQKSSYSNPVQVGGPLIAGLSGGWRRFAPKFRATPFLKELATYIRRALSSTSTRTRKDPFVRSE